MNFDDESLLSAYLDDELDAPRRAEVEAALRSHPELRRRLADLASARDLISGLSRPAAPADLSAAILARLAAGRVGPRQAPRRPRRAGLLILTGVTSLAASLMIARVATVPPPARPDAKFSAPARPLIAQHTPKVEVQDAKASTHAEFLAVSPAPVTKRRVASPATPEKSAKIASSAPSLPAGEPLTVAHKGESRPPSRVAASESSADRPAGDSIPVALNTARKPSEPEGAAEVRELLSRPGVRRLTVTVDVLDEQTIASMSELVQKHHKKQPRWGNVRVEQTLLLDPDRPGRAVIYAMVLDGSERDKLEKKLQARFPERVDKDELDPGFAEQLAATGDLTGRFDWSQSLPVAGLNDAPPGSNSIMGLRTTQEIAAAPAPAPFRGLAKSDPRADKKAESLRDEAAARSADPSLIARQGPSEPSLHAKRDDRPPRFADRAAASPPAVVSSIPAAPPARPLAPGSAAKGAFQNFARSQGPAPDRPAKPVALLGEDRPESTMTVLIWLTARRPGG